MIFGCYDISDMYTISKISPYQAHQRVILEIFNEYTNWNKEKLYIGNVPNSQGTSLRQHRNKYRSDKLNLSLRLFVYALDFNDYVNTNLYHNNLSQVENKLSNNITIKLWLFPILLT